MKRLTGLLSGLMLPPVVYLAAASYARGRSFYAYLGLAGLILLIYLGTRDADPFCFLSFPARFMRLLLFDACVYLALFAGWLLYQKETAEAGACAAFFCVATVLYLVFFRSPLRSAYRKIDRMDGHEFEEFCARVLSRNHFHRVQVTKGSHDYGADVLAYDRKGKLWVVQCKRYKGVVGNTPVQEVTAAMNYYDADCAAVIASAEFTENAKQLAEANGVRLIGREELGRLSRV